MIRVTAFIFPRNHYMCRALLSWEGLDICLALLTHTAIALPSELPQTMSSQFHISNSPPHPTRGESASSWVVLSHLLYWLNMSRVHCDPSNTDPSHTASPKETRKAVGESSMGLPRDKGNKEIRKGQLLRSPCLNCPKELLRSGRPLYPIASFLARNIPAQRSRGVADRKSFCPCAGSALTQLNSK